MIIRIVRMTFLPEKTDVFLDIFEQFKSQILEIEGCMHLELWHDLHEQNVYVTHSHWESEEALNNYRRSEFFEKIWKQTKTLFIEKAIAFSLEKVEGKQV